MKDIITDLLQATKREGMDELIEYITEGGFFEGPASTRHHGVYPGGLAEHSYNVYCLLTEQNHLLKLGCPADSIIIAALLHDLCKMGAYQFSKPGCTQIYANNPKKDKWHAALSILRISNFVKLTELEYLMIKYHMGVYGLNEFNGKGEYTLRGKGMIHAWHHNPIIKVMYFCDEMATLQEKVRDK